MRTSDKLQIGKAGEYIACADIIIKGLIAYPSEQGLPYDVVIDTGVKLLKCQVKTTTKPRKVPQRNKESIAYIFNIRRHGTNGAKIYDFNEVDLFALVELEERKVSYLLNKEMPTTINLRVDKLRGTYHDEAGIRNNKIIKDLKSKGLRQRDIILETGIHQREVNRMFKDDYTPFISSAKYFSDYNRDLEWFQQL